MADVVKAMRVGTKIRVLGLYSGMGEERQGGLL